MDQVSLQTRVTDLENQLASRATQYNEQVCMLESEVARLQSSLEQNEAIKQQLQYQIELERNTDRQKEAEWVEDRKKMEGKWREREKGFENQQINLQGRVVKLTQQCQEWSYLLAKVQQTRAKDASQTERTIATKDREITELKIKSSELDTIRNELERDIKNERRLVSNLKTSLHQLEGEVTKKEEEVERGRKELREVSDKMTELQQQLQVIRRQTSETEESLEAEKAAHLDTKFTCKVMQLQFEETQSTIEGERAARDLIKKELTHARTNLQDVKLSLDASYKQEQTLQKALESRELQCRSLGQKLKERDCTINDLNQQIQTSTSTCKTLQEGLTQVKQQRIKSDEMVKKWAREMEDLLREHQPHRLTTNTSKTIDTPQPVLVRGLLMQLADHFRSILTHHATELHSTNTQLTEIREKHRQMEKECEKLRRTVTSKDSAIREAEKHISECAEKISSLTLQLEQCRSALKAAREGEKQTRQEFEREKYDSQQTKMQLEETVANHKAKLKSRCSDLNTIVTSLHTLLVSTLPHLYGTQPPLSCNNWSKLISSTQSFISAIAEHTKTTSAKVKQLQSETDSLKSSLTVAQNTHRDAVTKLEHALEQMEDQWREKASELTAHYSTLLREAEQRAQQLQQFADDAMIKADETSSARMQLQAQLTQVSKMATTYKHDRACLLPCVSLLSATLFPLLSRVQQLTVHKMMLSNQLIKFYNLEKIVTGILHSLPQSEHSAEHRVCMKTSDLSSGGESRSAQMRFRKMVIVVLAVIHLKRLCKESTLLFWSPVPMNDAYTSLPVCVGRKHKKDKSNRSSRPTCRDMAAFLHGSKMLKVAREVMKDIVLQEPSIKSDVIASTNTSTLSITPGLMKDGYTSLMKQLSALFDLRTRCTLNLQSSLPSTTHPQSTNILHYSSDSLAKRLAGGISHITSNKTLETGRALYSKVTALLYRLHAGQETQHSLHSQLEQTRLEYQHLMQQQTEQLQQQLDHLHTEISSKSSQYQSTFCELKNKRNALTEALKELNEVRLEIKQRDLQLERAERQWQTADSERQTLELQLHNVQDTLHSTIREKEANEELMKVTSSVFQQSKLQFYKTNETRDSGHTMRLVQRVIEEFVKHRPDFSNYIGPTKEALESFVDAHHSVLLTVSSLQSQLDCATDYIHALKAELGAVSRRETAAAAYDGVGLRDKEERMEQGNDERCMEQEYVTLREKTLLTATDTVH